MIQFDPAIFLLSEPELKAQLRRAIENLKINDLPLQQGLSYSSVVLDKPFKAMVISVDRLSDQLKVKASIFYVGIIAGCSCADDPTPIDEQTEYCEVIFRVDTTNGCAEVTLVD